MTGPQEQTPNPWAPPPAPGSVPPAAQRPYLPPVGGTPPASPAPAPVAPAGPPTTGFEAPAGSFGAPSADPTIPVVAGEPGSSPKRSKGALIGAVVGVTALVAAGAFAVVKITGNDEAGGAATPEEVGTALTTALDNEDVLGVIDLLLPGERDTFRDPLVDLVGHLSRLEVLAPDADLSKIGGLDVQFSDVTVRAEPTNVDDITNIFLSGSASVSVDGEAVPIGDLLIDEAFDGDRPDMDQEADTEEFEDTQLTVVERDGRWYLSAFYSAAEGIRASVDDGDLDIPAEGVAPKGGDSPEGALDTLFGAVENLDLADMIAVLDPTEAEALQRYAPLFLEGAQDELDGIDIDWSISDTAYEVTGSGDRRHVQVTALTLEADIEGETLSLVVDGDCVRVSLDGEDEEFCKDDVQSQAIEDLGLADSEDLQALLDTVQDALGDWEIEGVAVHEVDGQWYVSPLRSYFDIFNGLLGALDAQELRDIVAAGSDFVEGVADDLGDSLDLPLDTGDDPFGDGSDGSDGSDDGATPVTVVPTDDTMVPTDDGLDAFTACFMELDPAAGVKCLNDGIADGSIDPTFVTVPFRHPECGVAEAYWSDVYSMPDDEFVELVTSASPCFLDLVRSGAVESWNVPSELLAPECLEVSNWYTVSDDSDYTTRFFDCTAEALADLP